MKLCTTYWLCVSTNTRLSVQSVNLSHVCGQQQNTGILMCWHTTRYGHCVRFCYVVQELGQIFKLCRCSCVGRLSFQGSCKKALSEKDSPKTLRTRVSCKTGTGLQIPTSRSTAHVGCRNLHSVHSVQLNSV